MKTDSRFATYRDIKEPTLLQEYHILPRAEQSHIWSNEFPGSLEDKFIAMKLDMIDTIRHSNKPVLDFSNCYNEATKFPENVKNLLETFNVSIICILRDPVDLLISVLNFMNLSSMIFKKNSTVEELEDRLSNPKFDGLVGLPRYSKWLPNWLELAPDIILLDYNRLHDIEYVSNTLGFEFQLTIKTSNVTASKRLQRDKLDIKLLNTLVNFYAEDKTLIDRLKR